MHTADFFCEGSEWQDFHLRILGFVLTALYGYSHIAVDNLFLSFGILLLLNGKVLPVLLAAIGYCGFQGRPCGIGLRDALFLRLSRCLRAHLQLFRRLVLQGGYGLINGSFILCMLYGYCAFQIVSTAMIFYLTFMGRYWCHIARGHAHEGLAYHEREGSLWAISLRSKISVRKQGAASGFVFRDCWTALGGLSKLHAAYIHVRKPDAESLI